MVKTLNINNNNLITIISIILIIILISYLFYSQNIQNKCMNDKEIINIKITNLENTLKNVEKNYINNNDDNNNNEEYNNQKYNNQPIVVSPQLPSPTINRDPRTMNSLDRIYNPLKYPYKSDYFYDQQWYPNLELPFQVLGCGGRNKPCLGGTQVPIYNPPTPIDISDNNIAPVYISTRGPLGQPQQVGILYKINGNDNDVYPLFGRKKYPNDNRYEYYTIMGNYGVKVPIVTKNKNDEVGTNDIVFVKGKAEPYRATIYKSDYPSYIPYL
jgi:hypothetical protein